ncbi:hypothetical protein [Glycomyces salinus]|uniref:hypothetical protein n=1 Tax=Glycomyces salinus TaxID=980294 RepID=UPI0018EB5CB7|nr:hypothetical protein [Glycomyces salinus]
MWVSIIAIISGAATGIGAPIISERMRRKSTRRELLLNRRIDTYAALLRVGATIRDNAMTWSAIPLADLQEEEDEELNRILSEIRVVASLEVFNLAKKLLSTVQAFNRTLVSEARPARREAERQGHGDSEPAIRARMRLADSATEIDQIYRDLMSAIRNDMSD